MRYGLLGYFALLIAGCGVAEPENRRTPVLGGINLNSPLSETECRTNYSLVETSASWHLPYLRLPPGIDVNITEQSKTDIAEHITFRYMIGGRPVCRIEGEAHRIRGEVFVQQDLPVGINTDHRAIVWPSLGNVFARVVAELGDVPEPLSSSECWFAESGRLLPAFDLALQIGGKNAVVIADGERILQVNTGELHAVGKANLYDTNPLTGRLTSSELSTLLEGGRAASAAFGMKLPDNREAATTDSTGQFLASPDELAFREISMFFNAEKYRQWLSRFGNQFLCVPIELYVDADMNSEVRTKIKPVFGKLGAEYLRPDFTRDRQPKILLGSGAGTSWKNLVLDRDVIAHEIGHHIFYRKLRDLGVKETSELHEGLSDFLTYAFGGDACLAESLCREGEELCFVPGNCLRSAELPMKYKDAEYNAIDARGHHIRGQVISALLWDLAKKLGKDETAKLVVRSVDYFSRAMSFQEFITALQLADKELHNSSNGAAIKEAATGRGL